MISAMLVWLVGRFSLVCLDLWVGLSNWERRLSEVPIVGGESHDSGLQKVVPNHMQKTVIKMFNS